MEYHDAVNRLYDLGRFGIRPGTASTADLLEHVGDPHADLSSVQIAGSNGKGSTARMLESILRAAGYRVGLYTSPHMDDMRWRIRVDGRPIPKSTVTEFVETCDEYLTERGADGDSPTFFETTTAMALWHFAREDVDFAVLEVGIGGKLDATSVVDPIASAVTSVSLEHTSVLGETVAEIARDKAHVVGDHPLVTATDGEALAAIREVADEVVTVGDGWDAVAGASDSHVATDVDASDHHDGDDSGAASDAGGSASREGDDPGTATDADRDHPSEADSEEPDVRVRYEGRIGHAESRVRIETDDGVLQSRLAAVGAHQAENAAIATTLARQIVDLADEVIARGLRNAHWPGRFEVMQPAPLVVLDGAHTPDACERLAGTLADFDYDELHLVVGAMHDKDYVAMTAALPTPDSVIACRPTNDRAVDPTILARVFDRRGVEDVRTISSVRDAIERARERAEPDDAVVVTGSLYVVAEARRAYTVRAVPTRVEDLSDADAVLDRADVTGKGTRRMRGKAVHRVVHVRIEERQAAYLKQELLSLGGECAISGLQREEQLVEAVCTGTLAQFKRLVEKLEAQPYGLAALGEDLRRTLGIGVDRSPTDWPWGESPAVMGICNVTPDSFHDGGEYNDLPDVVARAEAMVEAGASIVDVGGESTRPGADPIPVDEEIDRVVPVIERIADLEAAISIDTRKAAVAEAAIDAGADIVNDVSGLSDPAMRFVVADHDDVGLIVMHSIDAPVDPGRAVTYDDVVTDVLHDLDETVILAEQAGIDRERIVVDPGLGFGKGKPEEFELLDRIDEFRALGCPVLVGHSQKSMYDWIDQPAGERLHATVAATALAVDRGADIVRVHDVPENVAAVKTALATRDPNGYAVRRGLDERGLDERGLNGRRDDLGDSMDWESTDGSSMEGS